MTPADVFLGTSFQAGAPSDPGRSLIAQDWEAAKSRVVEAANFVGGREERALGEFPTAGRTSPNGAHSFVRLSDGLHETHKSIPAAREGMALIDATQVLHSAQSAAAIVGAGVKKLSSGQ